MMFHENHTKMENPWNVGNNPGSNNPWNVTNLDEFLYFCCPECDLRDQSKLQFLQHALEHHPKSKEYAQQFNEFVIKEEPREINEDSDFSQEFVMIKSEPIDDPLSEEIDKQTYDADQKQHEIIQNVKIGTKIIRLLREIISNKNFMINFISSKIYPD